MSTVEEPRHEIVYLEPPRTKLDEERTTLLDGIDLPAQIGNPTEYAAVASYEERLGAFITRTEPIFDEHCSAAHHVWKQACAIRAAFIDVPKQLKARARTLLGDYKMREQRERREAEQRIEAEQQRQALAARQREAHVLEQSGQQELAAVVRDAPVDYVAVRLPSAVPEVGLTYREDWYWEPAGGDTPLNRRRAIALLVKKDWAQFLKFDDASLTQFAKRNKDTVRIPGITFRSRQVPVRR